MISSVRALLLLVLACQAGTALAVNTRFLRSTPAARFNAQDFEKLQAAFLKAMDEGENAVTVEWRNPATGSAGAITPHDRFEQDGRLCRHTTVATSHRQRQLERGHVFCKGPDGNWQVIP
jgi:surface antigen